MPNPLVALRLDLNLTQEQAARLAGVSRLAVLRTEQGLYPLPPPRILHALADAAHVSAPRVEQEYVVWRATRQRQAKGALTDTLPPLEPDNPQQPLKAWRLHSGIPSLMGFCTTFLVHHAPVYNFEAGRQVKPPLQLLDALTQAGYGDTTDENSPVAELVRRSRSYAYFLRAA